MSECGRAFIKADHASQTSTAAPSINLPADSDRSWILDLQVESASLAGRHDVFVLTSSHITQVDPRQPGRALLSWAHGRHRDDISMYLDLFCSKDGMARRTPSYRAHGVFY